MSTSLETRAKRKTRIRKKVSGSTERPRLSVFRSLNNIYAQVIDDTTGKTLVHVSTLTKELEASIKEQNKAGAAKLVGVAVAKACLTKNITKVVFDRNGFDYHGRIAAVADGAREGGLQF